MLFKSSKESSLPQSPCGCMSLELALLSCQVLGKQFFPKESTMASSSFTNTDTSKFFSNFPHCKFIANRLEYLYEISHVPEYSKIPITDFPIVNPYIVFNKPQSSLKKTIKKYIGPSQSSTVTEYVQASEFDQFNILANDNENFITLTLPREFVILWKKQGYTHLHFGAIRLALTFHERKGLPAVSRITLLDSRLLEYQHTVIGTVQTTLNARIVFVTLFPNFNMPLKDTHLCDTLKVQVQITGASQIQDTYETILHYQLAYQLQNHSFDMEVLDMAQTNDALLIQVDPGLNLMCMFVP